MLGGLESSSVQRSIVQRPLRRPQVLQALGVWRLVTLHGVQRPAVLETNAGNDKGQPGVQRPIPAAIPPVYRRPAKNWYRLRNHVLQGKAKRTSSGLKAKDLGYSASTGKVVSLRASDSANSRYPGSKLEFWNKCTAEARRRLGIAGYCSMQGKSRMGQRLYEMTKAIRRMRSEG